MDEYRGWKITKRTWPDVWVAEQWGVTMNSSNLKVLQEMIDYRIYCRNEERKKSHEGKAGS